MVVMVMQQNTSAVASQPINPQSSLRSPPQSQPINSQPISLASAGPTPHPHRHHQHHHHHALDHAIGPLVPITVAHPSGEPAAAAASLMAAASPLARVRLSDIAPYDGAPGGPYNRAVEALAGSLMRHNAAVIELGTEDTALMRCGLEAARLYFRTRAQHHQQQQQQTVVAKGNRGVYMYRAGRALEDWDSSPPCMADIFKCMGKAARAALCAMARYLRLRSDVFNHLLDDTPLPANEVSSSVLVATYLSAALQNGKGAIGGGKPAMNGEVEKGLVTLISSDSPGLQVSSYYLMMTLILKRMWFS